MPRTSSFGGDVLQSASQIGHTTVASGPGPYPLVVPQPGQPPAAIYLTGAYKGAPFGLAIVVRSWLVRSCCRPKSSERRSKWTP